MSNNFVHNPTNDEIRLISINAPQVQEENRMSTNNNSPTLFSASNGIIINQSNSVLAVPATLFVGPRKVIVNHISPGGSSQKRFSNGDSKPSYSYRAIATENSATNNTTRAVVISPRIINPGTFTLRTPGGNTSVNRNFETKGEVVCPSCGASGRSLTHCETCKKKFNVNIIQSPRRPASSLLCSKPNSSTISHIGTLTSASMPNGITKTIIKSMPRLRPSIISGAKSVVPSPINKQLFYGEKTLRQNLDMSPNHTISSAIRTISVKMEPSVIPKQTRVRKQPMKRNLEPECLTLSSDEEESSVKPSSQGSTTDVATSYLNQENINTNSPSKSLDGEEFKNNEAKGLQSAATSSSREGESSLGLPVTGNPQSNNDSTTPYVPEGIRLMCRSIRIGSYKVQSADPPSLALDISKTCTRFSFPMCNTGNEKKIFTDVTIPHSDLESIMACFEKRLFVLFLYANQNCGIEVRNKLQMTKETSYFDPSATDETKKRIIVLPLNISDAEKTFMREIFTTPKLVDLTQSKANEILVRSTPVGASGSQNACMIRVPSAVTRSMTQTNGVPKENEAEAAVVNLCTYPAAPHTGGIAITSEDLACLKDGEYLNDVIIDFYLKYIYMEKLSKEDQDRTYIFSSFFFNRLITTPTKASYVKNNTKMSAKEIKHARVKTWTRHVDIFEKDFLIVPVNQSSHWYLVVICFPGKVSPDYIPEPKEKKGASKSSDVLSSASSENEESSLMSNEAEGNVPDSTTNSNLIPDIENPLPPVIGPLDESMEVDSTNSQNQNSSVTNETVDRKCEEQTIQSSEVQSTENPEPTVCSSKANPELKPIPQPESGKVPCIIVFDSLPGTSRWRVVASLRDYLEIEHQIKKGSTKFYDRVSMKGLNARVARQSNFSDCGVYLLQYAESFFQDPLECFATPLQDLSNWFGPEIINTKRAAITNLILDLKKRK